MSHQTRTYVTPEEYLEAERRAEYKNEYFDGEVLSMTGASRAHNLFKMNILGSFWQQLKGKDCEVYPSDMRVRIPSANIYTYPDVVVVCGEPKLEDEHLDTLLNPTLLVEVLSKSTASYDRNLKFEYYRTLESLEEYLLVSQEQPRVARHAKQTDGKWLLTDFASRDDAVEVASVGCTLRLGDVYEKIEF